MSVATGAYVRRCTSRWTVASTAVLALALAGCGERGDGQSVGQKVDAAIAKTQDVAERARDKVVASEPAMREGATSVKEAARETGAAVASTVEDVAITASVSSALAKDAELSASRIDVDTHKGVVKLKGPAPTAAAKARAGDIAKAVDGVSRVENLLEVRAM